MKPKEIKTFDDICKLKRDNVSYDDAWIILNGVNELVITNQKRGEPSTGTVKLSKRQFQKFVD